MKKMEVEIHKEVLREIAEKCDGAEEFIIQSRELRKYVIERKYLWRM